MCGFGDSALCRGCRGVKVCCRGCDGDRAAALLGAAWTGRMGDGDRSAILGSEASKSCMLPDATPEADVDCCHSGESRSLCSRNAEQDDRVACPRSTALARLLAAPTASCCAMAAVRRFFAPLMDDVEDRLGMEFIAAHTV